MDPKLSAIIHSVPKQNLRKIRENASAALAEKVDRKLIEHQQKLAAKLLTGDTNA